MLVDKSLYSYIDVETMLNIDIHFGSVKGVLYKNEDTLFRFVPNPGEPNLTPAQLDKLHKIIGKSSSGSFAKLKNSQYKSKMNLIPLNVVREVADVYADNFNKYGDDWKVLPDAKNVFYDAMFRHLERWQSGEEIDPEDNKLHIIKVVANAMFLAWHCLKDNKNG